MPPLPDSTLEKLLRHQKSLVEFGVFGFRETDPQAILDEAARILAVALRQPYTAVWQHRISNADLFLVAGYGWPAEVVGRVSVPVNDSPLARVFATGIAENGYPLSELEAAQLAQISGVVATSRIAAAIEDMANHRFGVFAVYGNQHGGNNEYDVILVTEFANILAEIMANTTRTDILRATISRLIERNERSEILVKEHHHRIRNSLHSIYSLLYAELREAETEGARSRINSIALRVTALAKVYDHLLGTNLHRHVNLATYLATLCDSLSHLHGKPGIKLACEAPPVVFAEVDITTVLGIVVAELISNSYLHAFPTGVGRITVDLRDTEAEVILRVGDDGKGFVTNEHSTRHGLRLMHRLVRQIDGTLTVASTPASGTEWTIVFPPLLLGTRHHHDGA